MVRDDVSPGSEAIDDHGPEHHGAQPGHGDLGEQAARLEPARHGAAAVDHPRPAGEAPRRGPQHVFVCGHAVGQFARPAVERQGDRGASSIRISPRPRSTPSPDQRVYRPSIWSWPTGIPAARQPVQAQSHDGGRYVHAGA